MLKTIKIHAGTLVVLSGLPGAGKSRLKSLALNLPEAAWLSFDALRRQVLGSIVEHREGRRLRHLFQEANEAVVRMAFEAAKARLTAGLTTVVDATSLNDAARRTWVELARSYGAPALVLILDTSLEQCLLNMQGREDWVPDARIREMDAPPAPQPTPDVAARYAKAGKVPSMTPPTGFERTSEFEHRLISSDTVLEFTGTPLLSSRCDVIGDVHGLFDELLVLLAKAGWQLCGGRLRHADPLRRLVFLGDLVDRGPRSIDVLELVKRAVDDGLAQCLLGNHEAKLLRFVDTALVEGIERWSSYANAETGMQMLALCDARRKELVAFMRGLPAHLVHDESMTAFVHADVHRFEPLSSLKADLVHGQSGWKRIDSDALYEESYALGLNRYTLVRGHIPATSVQPHVFSLERHAFQRGELMLLRFDEFLERQQAGQSSVDAFAASLLTQPSDNDFEAYAAKRFELIRAMEGLVERKLATRYFDESKLLRGYKYSREVFWNGSWGESEWLLKARGLVMDASGTVVSHPFNKVFNFGERDTGLGLPEDMPVIEVEKLNGFLGIVSAHPLKPGELLVHTQGSMGDSDFTKYVQEFLDPRTRGLLCQYLSKHRQTLLFEVLHPEDPHIVEYSSDMMGLHLIGARGLQLADLEVTEEALDAIALELRLRRPAWRRTTLGQTRQKLRDCRHEGYMLRADTPEQLTLLKWKSPFYLTAKFLGRLSDKKVRHMYGSSSNFKKQLDEELYPLVDAVTSRFSLGEFLAMPDEARIPRIRELINELQ